MKYFKPTEFVMGDDIVFDKEIVFDKMNPMFLEELDHIREIFGKPIVLNSSYRSKEYNEYKEGHRNSQHLLGSAVDIKITSYSKEDRVYLLKILLDRDLTVGIAKNFWHIDNRENQTIFGY